MRTVSVGGAVLFFKKGGDGMLNKIYRIQAYATWALFIALGLLAVFGKFDVCNKLRLAGVLLPLFEIAMTRLLLPVGTVLAVFARKKGFSPNSLLHHQMITSALKLAMIPVMLMLLVVLSGGA